MKDDPDWWDSLFPDQPHPKPPGAREMLRLVVYDITSPARLRRVAKVCEDFGTRVQKSVFECWLDDERYNRLWSLLLDQLDSETDSIVGYTLDAGTAKSRRTGGQSTEITQKRTRVIV
jgi:CRISPR-associated protein Cas2